MSLPFQLFCPFHTLTGLHCPFCGLMRAFAALWRLDVAAAFGHNALVMLALPVLVYAVMRWALEKRGVTTLPQPRLPRWGVPVILGVVAVFWVARNLPMYPFTLLAP